MVSEQKFHEQSVASIQYTEEENYWLKKLSGDWIRTAFPYDSLGGISNEGSWNSTKFRLPVSLFEKLMKLRNESDNRLFMILVAGLMGLLAKYTDTDDIILGAPTLKQDIEAEFLNTILVLRNQIDDSMTFKDILLEVRRTIIEASENQNYPIETLAGQLNIPIPENGDCPFFDIAVLLENIHDKSYMQHTKINMTFSFSRTDEYIDGTIDYNSSLYEGITIDRIIEYFIHFLETALQDVNVKISTIDIFTAKDKQRVLVDFNDTGKDLPGDILIHRLFEEQVEKTPDGIALVFGSRQLTYRELNNRANRTARQLTAKGVSPDTVVGIVSNPSFGMIIGLLGILKAGGAYLPIDPTYPAERITFIMADSAVNFVVAEAGNIETAMPEALETVPIIISLDDCQLCSGEAGNLSVSSSPSDAAYVIYTSGTTGHPKGVIVEHRHVGNTLCFRKDEYNIDANVVALQLFSYAFDGFVTSFFTPVVSGAKVVLLSREDIRDIYRIKDAVVRNNVTHFICVPPLFQSIVDASSEKELASLKVVTLAGDQLLSKTVETAKLKNKHLEIAHEYGVTEAAVQSTLCRHQEKEEVVKIGKPIWNTAIYITGESDRPKPPGIAGELCIGGKGVSRGYLNRPELTAEKFKHSSTSLPLYPSTPLYRTGDRARWLPDGNLEFLGRIDHQVKIRGYRIEPGEIENLLLNHIVVQDAVVVPWAQKEEDKQLVAYIVPDNRNAKTVRRLLHLEKENLLNNRQTLQLPNRMTVFYLNRDETELMYRGIFEKREYLKHGISLNKGACVFDVGANIGMFSLLVNHVCKDVKIYLFEPIPPVLEVLKLNVEIHGLKAEVFEYGLSDREEEVTFTYYPHATVLSGRFPYIEEEKKSVGAFIRNRQEAGESEERISENQLNELLEERLSRESVTCRVKSFSQVIRENSIEKIDLLKIVVEKSELDVLNGIDDEDWQKIKQVVVEVHDVDGALDKVEKLIRAHGYRVTVEQDPMLEHTDLHHVYAVLDQEEDTVSPGGRGIEEPAADSADNWYGIEQVKNGLREYLNGLLPDYMVPSSFVLLEELPLSSNGKVDRKALPAPVIGAGGGEFIAPRDSVEKELAEIWSDVLGIRPEIISIDSNFFEHGGYSIKATQLNSKIHKKFNVKMALAEIFKTPTIRGLSEGIRKAGCDRFIPLKPVDDRDYYPATSAQERLYVLQGLDLSGTSYNAPIVVELDGLLDRKRFEDIFKKLIDRHESLRTSFEMIGAELAQKIHNNVEFDIQYYTLPEDGDAKPTIVKQLVEGFVRPFNLSTAPLLRVGLVEIEGNRHILMVDMHHIISDGTSLGIMVKEFMMLYKGEELPAVTIRYRDYSQWLAHYAREEIAQKQEQFWLKEFEGEPPVLNLPIDFARPAEQSFEGDNETFAIGKTETSRIRTFISNRNTTLFVVLLAVYNVFLSKLSSQEDIVVGVGVEGRRHEDLQKIIGMFVNTLPLRNFPKAEESFMDFLTNVKDRTLAAFENQEYQFSDLVGKLVMKRDKSRNPLFDVMLQVGDAQVPEIEIPGLTLKPYRYEDRTSKFDLTLWAYEGAEELVFKFEYCTKLFKRETIQLFIRYFKEIVSSIAADPDKSIREICRIPEASKAAILLEMNRNLEEENRRMAAGNCILQHRLNSSFEKYAAKIALEYGAYSLTYDQLNRRSDYIARRLREKNIAREVFIGVLMNDRARLICTALAIIKAGCVFVPLDVSYPRGRLEVMIRAVDMELIIADGVSFDLFGSDSGFRPEGVEMVLIDDWLDREESFTSGGEIDVRYSPEDKVYVYFTSGSTGVPQAILGRNIGLLHFIDWEIDTFHLDEKSRFSQLITPGFDAFLRDVLVPLCCGGIICIPESTDVLLSGGTLAAWLESSAVHLVSCVPSLFRLLNAELRGSDRLPQLRVILFSGERITAADLSPWFERFGERIQLVNLWGTSETTLAKTFHVIRPCDLESGRVPVGKGIRGSAVLVLDERLELCDKLVKGELYIRTPFRSFGYYKNSLLNKERFIRNPFSNETDDILHKTGDFGRILADGTIDLLGRNDRQVKIRGIRVELEEIESVLRVHPQVGEVVVIKKEVSLHNEILQAYVTEKENIHTEESFFIETLRVYLEEKLPGYMVPSVIMRIDRIPRNANGKVAYDRLEEYDVDRGEYVAPVNEIERGLVALWCNILKRDRVSTRDNFFSLGGNSLNIMNLISYIQRDFYVRVPLADIFNNATIEKQAKIILEAHREIFAAVEPVEKKEYYVVSSAQKRLYILQQMELSDITYNMQQIVLLGKKQDRKKLERIFQELISRHESFRTSFHIIGGELMQKVHDHVEFDLQYYDCSNSNLNSPGECKTTKRILRDFIQPFDLGRAPLLRVGLINTPEGKHLLAVDMHHIISDAVSTTVLINEFTALYSNAELPDLPLQYKDFSEWQSRLFKSGVLDKQREYWMNRFKGGVPVLHFPAQIQGAAEAVEGNTYSFRLGSEFSAKVHQFALETGTTLYMILLAVFTIILSRYTDQEDIVVGSPIFGRSHADLQNIIGMFVNMLPMRNFPRGDKSFVSFLNEVKTNALDAYENQDYQFEQLVWELGERISGGYQFNINAVFVLQNVDDISTSAQSVVATEIDVMPFEFEMDVSKFDITLAAVEVENDVLLEIEYSKLIFTKQSVARLADYFKNILQYVIENPKVPISEIEMVSEKEKLDLIKALRNEGDSIPRSNMKPDQRKTKKMEVEFDF